MALLSQLLMSSYSRLRPLMQYASSAFLGQYRGPLGLLHQGLGLHGMLFQEVVLDGAHLEASDASAVSGYWGLVVIYCCACSVGWF